MEIRDTKKYVELLMAAIDGRMQKDFAERAGISQSHLNRMLKSKEGSKAPYKKTLEKIADASDGRVTKEQLFAACGYTADGNDEKDNKEDACYGIGAKALEKTSDKYISALHDLAGKSYKYNSLNVFMEAAAVDVIQAPRKAFRVHTDNEYDGMGRNGAERIAHCSAMLRNLSHISVTAFTLFYCRTEKGGIIITDCVSEMKELVRMAHPVAMSYLFKISEKGSVVYSNIQKVFDCEKRKDMAKETKLLIAIFGEDEDDDESASDETECPFEDSDG